MAEDRDLRPACQRTPEPHRASPCVNSLAVDGRRVHVRGLDAVDGTPVLDIKPVMRAFLPRGELIEPAWVAELMEGYWDGPEIDNDP